MTHRSSLQTSHTSHHSSAVMDVRGVAGLDTVHPGSPAVPSCAHPGSQLCPVLLQLLPSPLEDVSHWLCDAARLCDTAGLHCCHTA